MENRQAVGNGQVLGNGQAVGNGEAVGNVKMERQKLWIVKIARNHQVLE